MTGNDFMAWVLRSPFHGLLSGNTMLITLKGRKTGKESTIPVNYYEDGNCLWVVSSSDRTWWRNLKDGADVSLLLKRKPIRAFAELELGQEAVSSHMTDYVQHFPQAAKPLGIRMENGQANADDAAQAAKTRLFIKLIRL